MLSKLLSFVKKDFLIESSYRLAFVLNIAGVLLSIIGYYFIDRLFGSRMVGYLEEFQVGYFPYVLLSMGLFSYIGVGMGSFSNRIRYEQIQGTLYSLLLTPTRIYTILFSMALWNLIIATFDMIIYLVLGAFFFKIDFSQANIFSALCVLGLTTVSFGSLGILSAGFVVLCKRGNPVSWILNNAEGLLGGVYFPVAVLPAGLQILSRFLPITYAVRAMQLAVYRGYSLAELSREIGFLSLFALALIPLSLFLFRLTLKKAQKDGNLLMI